LIFDILTSLRKRTSPGVASHKGSDRPNADIREKEKKNSCSVAEVDILRKARTG